MENFKSGHPSDLTIDLSPTLPKGLPKERLPSMDIH